MRILFSLVIFIIIFAECNADQYKLIRVYSNSEESLELLLNSPFSQSMYKSSARSYNLTISSSEFGEFLNLKLPYDMISDNAEETISQHLKVQNYNNLLSKGSYFNLGSMNGYFTLNEIYSEIDRMADNYPDYFTKDSIGTTLEGRTIFSYSIGNLDCSNNNHCPEVLITALHHAREPGSIFSIIFYLWDLLERYDSGNENAPYILNNRLIYLIPVVNPDGVAFNESNYPQGGGLWRKNRRKINDSVYGVDLNRNYGPQYAWDAPNAGSSLTEKSDVYRGAEPFSEPETASVRDFLKGKNIKTAVNFHTFGDAVFYPSSYLVQECKDSAWYRQFLHENYRNNRYLFGLDKDVIKYSTRGGSDDFMYIGDEDFNGFLSMSCEIGSPLYGFWSPQDIMLENATKNLTFIENVILSADKNIALSAKDAIIKEGKFYLNLSIANVGYEEIKDLELELKSTDNKILIYESNFTIDVIKRGEAANIQIEYYPQTSTNGGLIGLELIANLPYKKVINFDLPIFEYIEYDMFSQEVLESSVFDDGWHISDDQLNGKVLNSNFNESYTNNSNTYATFSVPELKDSIVRYSLHFDHNYSIESYYDFGMVWSKNENNESFNADIGEYLAKGVNRPGGMQADTLFGFHGTFKFWHPQAIYLSNNGEIIKEFAFNLRTDYGTTMAGWKIKNLKLRAYPYKTTSNVKIAKPDKIVLSPNPASDFITISLPTLNKGLQPLVQNAQIFDVLGIEVISVETGLRPVSTKVDVSHLAAGVYFIKIGDKVEKFVKL